MASGDNPDGEVDQLISQYEQTRLHNGTTATAPLPPGKHRDVDKLLAEMKSVPLFMTSLDDLDDDNPQLEALKALAYEGTPAENAENFKTQGNELVAMKKWRDAREFYTKALQALKMPQPQAHHGATSLDLQEWAGEVDAAEEVKKERAIEEACYANRALCNLEMRNYGSCNKDCAEALRLNLRNVKAWYRAASACLALDKIAEAIDACERGLAIDSNKSALVSLNARIAKRRDHLAELEEVRQRRLNDEAQRKNALRLALRQRRILARETGASPNLEDAAISLSDPQAPDSRLSFPVMFLYPLHAQSDFVKAFAETEPLSQHLEYILPPPWDEAHEYFPMDVDCYLETIQGGLIKAGKNVSLLKLLSGGKLEVVDGLVKVNVVPKAKAAQWIVDFKQRRGRG